MSVLQQDMPLNGRHNCYSLHSAVFLHFNSQNGLTEEGELLLFYPINPITASARQSTPTPQITHRLTMRSALWLLLVLAFLSRVNINRWVCYREGKNVLQAGMKIQRNVGRVSKATPLRVKLQGCLMKESLCGKVGSSIAEQVNQVSALHQISMLPSHCLHFLFILFQVKGTED